MGENERYGICHNNVPDALAVQIIYDMALRKKYCVRLSASFETEHTFDNRYIRNHENRLECLLHGDHRFLKFLNAF